MTDELIKDWHPLDGVPAPDYIPPFWDGAHVGKRLVEGLRILQNVAMRGAGHMSNAWPAYPYEWTDQLAQLEAETEEQKRDAQQRNWTRVIPSSDEITKMEAVIAWPCSYLADIPQLLSAVHVAAYARARYRHLHWAARRLKLPPRLLRRWNREGLDLIASGLLNDKVSIF
jgi:hypothetical protein